jgi:hypothetical protein
LLAHDQVNSSSITKITSWFKFLGKNLHLEGCATVCAKSEVMLALTYIIANTSSFGKVQHLAQCFTKLTQPIKSFAALKEKII